MDKTARSAKTHPPLSAAQLAQRRAAGQARAAAFTPESQRAASLAQSRAQKQAAGRAGWQVTCERHGLEHAWAKAAAARRKHPTKLERRVMKWLKAAGLPYQHEACVNGWYVDLVVAGRLAVEIDGAIWHTPGALFCDAGSGERAARKERAVRATGLAWLRLSEAEIKNDTGRARLWAALAEAPHPGPDF